MVILAIGQDYGSIKNYTKTFGACVSAASYFQERPAKVL